MNRKYAVGIDLGTTNSVLAYTDITEETSRVECLPIPQYVAPGTMESPCALPSFLYITTDEDKSAESFKLPWDERPVYLAGEWARRQSADVPSRTVAAAKSWLCHSHVDRRQPILPWNAPEEVGKISPIEASRHYLEHLAAAWNQAFPDAPLKDQQVVLTVPASFDVSARELTHEAAMAAGLPDDLVLLEEPQAALYAWLHDRGDQWRRKLGEGDVLLVCDVGGGTTDFSLIRVESEKGNLVLRRIAVGNHILVGGDNMDLALAHAAREALAEKNVDIDAWQSVALWHACRAAKEQLLREDGPEKHAVSALGRGSRLIGGSISVELERERVANLLLDGFFSTCNAEDRPARRRSSGFREIGLPFESDTAITRHLAQFLAGHGENNQLLRPTRVLFNGGVLKASLMRKRLMEVLTSWFSQDQAPIELEENHDLDFAVAKGAAYYGFTKANRGIRIRGGAARSYYLGIETAGLAVPGAPRPLSALCIVPHGMEEGTEVDIPGGDIGLVVGEQAHFRFFSSSVRKEDQPGDVIDRWTEEDIRETDSLETTLPAARGVEDDIVPVRFQSRITELGMFELWCHSTVSDDRWKFEFSVREDAET